MTYQDNLSWSMSNSEEGKTEVIIPTNPEGRISLRSAILLLCSNIIGTGIFMTANSVVDAVKSVTYCMITWIFCGIISMLASLCYCEMGHAFPSLGGEYTYLRKVFHNMLGFACLVTNMFMIRPVCLAMLVLFFAQMVMSTIVSDYLNYYWTTRLISIASIIIVCILNCVSEKWTVRVNDFLTYLKFICMAIIIGIAAYMLCKGQTQNIRDPGLSIFITPKNASEALYNGMWAYDGFNQLGFIVTKMANPTKHLVPANVIGMSIVITLYCLINFSYLVVLGVDALASTDNIVKSVVQPFWGGGYRAAIIFVALSAFATANSTSYSGGNLYFDAASNHHFPRLLAASHIRLGTYIPSLFFQTLLTILYLLTVKDIEQLLLYFSGASWVYYSLVFLGVIVLRFRNHNPGRFKISLIVPGITFAIGVTIIVLGFMADWFSSLISVSTIIASIPLYFIFLHNGGIIPKSFTRSINVLTDLTCDALGLAVVQAESTTQ